MHADASKLRTCSTRSNWMLTTALARVSARDSRPLKSAPACDQITSSGKATFKNKDCWTRNRCENPSMVGSAMKKWKSENLAFNCSYKQHYVSNKQLRIQISEITARCSAIASRKSKLSWPLTSGLNKTYFQQLAGSWQFAFCLHVLSTVPAVLATAQIGKLTFTSKCFRTRNEW